MGQLVDWTLDRIRLFSGQFKNLWDNTIRFQWSHGDFLKYRKEILDHPEYRKLPRWAKEYLSGYDMARFDLVWRDVVFSYKLGCKRVTIESAEWNKAAGTLRDREKRGTFSTDTGAHVWRADNSKFWTQPKE